MTQALCTPISLCIPQIPAELRRMKSLGMGGTPVPQFPHPYGGHPAGSPKYPQIWWGTWGWPTGEQEPLGCLSNASGGAQDIGVQVLLGGAAIGGAESPRGCLTILECPPP